MGLDYLIWGLTEGGEKDDPLFQELYSWYLRSREYSEIAQRLTQAVFMRKPSNRIGGKRCKGSLRGGFPLQRHKAGAVCSLRLRRFLKYGLAVTERAEYEFRAMDMGNVLHQALERFAAEIQKRGLDWRELKEEERDRIAGECLEEVTADYGNTILKSSARNQYMIQRTFRILKRTLWALQEQLRNGEFVPEGFEFSIGGGRIDRLDVLKEDKKVYVKIIDYKSGNTTFDLVGIYHGLQLQLVVYMDAAMEAEKKNILIVRSNLQGFSIII